MQIGDQQQQYYVAMTQYGEILKQMIPIKQSIDRLNKLISTQDEKIIKQQEKVGFLQLSGGHRSTADVPSIHTLLQWANAQQVEMGGALNTNHKRSISNNDYNNNSSNKKKA